MTWSVRLIVVLQLFAVRPLLFLIVSSPLYPLSLSHFCLLAVPCLWSPPPSALLFLPPNSPHVVAVGWCGFLSYRRGCGCRGDSWRYFGILVSGRGRGGTHVVGQKSSELSSHQILVGGELGRILRAGLSSNAYPRVARTNLPS